MAAHSIRQCGGRNRNEKSMQREQIKGWGQEKKCFKESAEAFPAIQRDHPQELNRMENSEIRRELKVQGGQQLIGGLNSERRTKSDLTGRGVVRCGQPGKGPHNESSLEMVKRVCETNFPNERKKTSGKDCRNVRRAKQILKRITSKKNRKIITSQSLCGRPKDHYGEDHNKPKPPSISFGPV